MNPHETSASPHPNDAPTPTARRLRRPILRWIEQLLAAVGLLFLLLMATPLGYHLYVALDRHDELRKSKYIVCLGGDLARVIEAARLLREGWAETLIVSNYGPYATAMRDMAIDWGAPADRVLVDNQSRRTRDHPRAVRALGVDPARDSCIIVTSFAHMARARACFHKAGYRHLVMREPRWERDRPTPGLLKTGFFITPKLLYEYAAWVEYKLRGDV